ncbi:hypothetical protein [Natronomonas amylolytica]|uniref:hypothetical protein n=1 Tax=Natronomonas amylolytica TaxID=3108498 RepID=UPI0030086260
MATDKPTPPEGFEEFESSTNDGETETVDLDPGEVLSGVVLDLTEGENDNGPWYRLKIKDESRGLVKYFAKDQAKRAAAEGRIEVGEPIWIAMDTEEESFERRDGETVTYNPTKVAFPGGN